MLLANLIIFISMFVSMLIIIFISMFKMIYVFVAFCSC